jgi:hypothetical protein
MLASWAGADEPAPSAAPAPATAAGGQAAAPAAAPEKDAKISDSTEVTLTLRDGRTFDGMLVRRSESETIITIAGVETRFKASEIEKLRELPPVLDRYAEMVKMVPADQLDRRMELINWLADRRHLDIAVIEAERLAARNPRSATVKKLVDELRLKEQLLKPATPARDGADTREVLKGTASPAAGREEAPPADAEVPSAPTTAPVPARPATDTSDVLSPTDSMIPVTEFPLLTARQINLLKVYEVDLSDEPNIVIPRAVVQQLLDAYSGSPLVPSDRTQRDAMLRQNPLETMDLMYRLKARDFYPRVQIVDHPRSIRMFRDDVHRSVVLNSCATNMCHGGSDAGRLVLSTFRPNADPTLYTNFYILSRFRTSDGLGLIDAENPEQSLLVQMGLPREMSRAKHPPVMRDGRDIWRPTFSGLDDRRYLATVEWLKSLYRPRPVYELEYEPYRPFVRPPKPVFENVER